MFYELEHKILGYMFTIKLENGVTLHTFDNGTGIGSDGKNYRVVTHLDEEDEVVTDGWEAVDG